MLTSRERALLVDQLVAIVRRRDEHRAAAEMLDETRKAFERHAADEHMEAKFQEFVALLTDAD